MNRAASSVPFALRQPARARFESPTRFSAGSRRNSNRATWPGTTAIASPWPLPVEASDADTRERVAHLLRIGGCAIALAVVLKTSGVLVQGYALLLVISHYLFH